MSMPSWTFIFALHWKALYASSGAHALQDTRVGRGKRGILGEDVHCHDEED